MSDMRHYMGMSIMGRTLMRNFAPDELQTVRLTKTQFGALISALSSDLPENAAPNATTPHQCSLVAYQAGFQDTVLERQELEKNRAPEAHPSRETYEQQMCPLCSAQFSNHSNTNSPSSSPSSVPKDARTDSTSKAGNETVAQGTQTELPEHETLRSLDGVIHQGVKMDTQPDTLSEQARLDLLKDCTETAEETVAQPAFELSVEELLQINRGFIPEELKLRALNELKRRTGEDEASS